MQRVRTVARYIKSSSKAKEKVGSFLELQNVRVVVVTLDVRCTRCNSAHDMILKSIQMKDAIYQFLVFLKSVSGRRDFDLTESNYT